MLPRNCPPFRSPFLLACIFADKEESSASESEEEDEPSQVLNAASPTAALSTQINLTVHAAFAKKSENIKLSPYCVVSEAIKIILQDMDIDLEKYPLADLRLCKSSRGGLGAGENRVWLDPNMSLHSYHLKTGVRMHSSPLNLRIKMVELDHFLLFLVPPFSPG